MPNNTGKVIYGTLIEVSTDTGIATGATKQNATSDQDYIPPHIDLTQCSLPIDNSKINNIQVEFINSTSQSLSLQTAIVRPFDPAIPDAYLSSTSVYLLPRNNFITLQKAQTSITTSVNFIVQRLALGIRVNAIISYKKQTDSTYTVLATVTLNVGDTLNSVALNTPIDTLAVNLNNLRITLIDNPVTIPINALPVVNAGSSQSITTQDSLLLFGTATQANGTITSVLWKQVSGPNVAVIITSMSLATSINKFIAGVYIFQLTATNNLGKSVSSIVQITVTIFIQTITTLKVFVDSLMPNDAIGIGEIKLIPYNNTAPIVIAATANRTTGVLSFSSPIGNYKLSITINGSITNDRSLKIISNGGANVRKINIPQNGIYIFENIINNSTEIVLSSIVEAAPTNVIVFASKVISSPTIVRDVTIDGSTEMNVGNIDINFLTTFAGNTPIAFVGKLNYHEQVFNNILNIIQSENSFSSIVTTTTYTLSTNQAYRRYDTTHTLVISQSLNWSILPGEGYLIIP
jgi:hypothetical protein